MISSLCAMLEYVLTGMLRKRRLADRTESGDTLIGV